MESGEPDSLFSSTAFEIPNVDTHENALIKNITSTTMMRSLYEDDLRGSINQANAPDQETKIKQ